MATENTQKRITVEQTPFLIPDLTVKDLLSAIPAHCYKRSAVRSMSYVVYDFVLIYCIYKVTVFADAWITPEHISLPNPFLYTLARFSLWALYSLANGLVGTGIWVLAHECGHQAFSESKTLNNTVGWFLHSAVGVPYHSWRISHAKHHASTGHMTQDQVYVPKTRSQIGLPALDQEREDIYGSSVTEEVKQELWEAVGDSPIGASLGVATYLLGGWWMYILLNASGQKRYPKGTNHLDPSATMFAPHHRDQILISDVGIALWFGAVCWAIYAYGFVEVFRVYLVPYLWVNHWLVLITFLQHTDPILPHYRAPEFTFPRGALTTLDRDLLGDCGSIMSWLGAHLTHGISETHVAHHVASKIPHYNAWEASDALRKRLAQAGLVPLKGRPGGWSEMYRVYDEGDIVFYKDARGLAQARPVFTDNNVSDSGIELEKDA
ncbi:delta12-fatty acid desaturase [Fomitopsis serialis]|uniref:delta12-fatty acid desaturase n=1 Tax=Fomitopsis serialis TaxID=139415 RepID=UPI0020087ABA|nr:delta12-fatty acid desaturase [Neoantrodia serialis]KAH9936095.1 delta12-fatty acid desaturase [Neoantrodia serialis]